MSAVSLFDWQIYRSLFSAPRMEEIFGERGTLARMVDVERAIARTQAGLGVIPAEAAAAIQERLDADGLDMERLRADTQNVGRPIIGLAKQLAEQTGEEEYGVWVHYGITTYDVMDTAKVLQVRDGMNEIVTAMDTLTSRLRDMASAHRDTVMIGRTNNLHAQPTTFGAKLATWIEEMGRHRERLEAALTRVSVAQFGGAVGTLASLEPDGLRFRQAMAEELGLGVVRSNWHNARDSMTEVALALGNLCASLARIAQNVNALGGTDIGEVSEGGEPGRGRSSAMAHKRNPRAAEFAEAVARLGRQRAQGMLEVMGQDHDRCGGTWIAEWMLIPETFLLTSGALAWAIDLFGRLEVHTERMRDNVDAMNGLALTERFTLALAKHMNKFEARRLIDEACGRVGKDGVSLADALGAMPEVLAVMSEAEIAELSAPETYVGAAPEIVDDVLAASAPKE